MLANSDISDFDYKQLYTDILNNYCFDEFPYFRSGAFLSLDPKHNTYRVNTKLMLHLMVNLVRLCRWTLKKSGGTLKKEIDGFIHAIIQCDEFQSNISKNVFTSCFVLFDCEILTELIYQSKFFLLFIKIKVVKFPQKVIFFM